LKYQAQLGGRVETANSKPVDESLLQKRLGLFEEDLVAFEKLALRVFGSGLPFEVDEAARSVPAEFGPVEASHVDDDGADGFIVPVDAELDSWDVGEEDPQIRYRVSWVIGGFGGGFIPWVRVRRATAS
jgi:hypothetical protein